MWFQVFKVFEATCNVILGMVLIESIAIYGLLVALLLWLKLP